MYCIINHLHYVPLCTESCLFQCSNSPIKFMYLVLYYIIVYLI
nr:MAG TPA: hypothetical protein [Caudoviricetes sp.]